MTYVVTVPHGRYIINDDLRVTLTVAWTDDEQAASRIGNIPNAKMRLLREVNATQLADYDWLCEEDMPDINGIYKRVAYFARPGLYHFVPDPKEESLAA